MAARSIKDIKGPMLFQQKELRLLNWIVDCIGELLNMFISQCRGGESRRELEKPRERNLGCLCTIRPLKIPKAKGSPKLSKLWDLISARSVWKKLPWHGTETVIQSRWWVASYTSRSSVSHNVRSFGQSISVPKEKPVASHENLKCETAE